MLVAVVVLKSLTELSLMVLLGRYLLGVMAGASRQANFFWQILDIAAKPALWLTRRFSPKVVLDRHIPLAATSWLLITWVLLVKTKIDLCQALAHTACR